LAFSFTFDEF